MQLKRIKTTCSHTFIVIDENVSPLKPHSSTEPAVIYPDGTEEYYLYGVKYEKSVWDTITKEKRKQTNN